MNSLPAASESTRPLRQLLRARWVFPVEQPPIENGTIEIVGGRIAAMTSLREPAAIQLGNIAIIPGLVNAHTHLELSDAAEPLQPSVPFTAWLKAVLAHRRARAVGADALRQVVHVGAREALLTGTTLLGDIVSADWRMDGGPAGGSQMVNFLELLGLSPERIEPQLALARTHLQGPDRSDAGTDAERSVRGLSPHAPYSVHPELFARLVRLADEFRAPLAMHLAETRAELELLDRGTGDFVDFLCGLDVWQPTAIPKGMRPLDYLRPLATLAHPLVIHGNYLSEGESDFLADCRVISVVYCPRTHAYFGHAPHPWRQLLGCGVNVALGTDSRASNPDLSVWNELRFLRRRHPDVASSMLLELGTIRGARALGFATETGSLTPGKGADLAFIQLPEIDSTDPFELLFHPASRVSEIMCRGRWAHPTFQP